MRIGGMTRGKTRREERREKELEIERSKMVGIRDIDESAAQPAKAKGDEVVPAAVVKMPDNELLMPKHEDGALPMPDQKELIQRSIQPRHNVEIIVEDERNADDVEVRQSVIEDMDDDGKLYLAQTSPPFLRSQAGRVIEPTFLSRYYDIPEGRWLRVGYRTPIIEVIPDYRLASGDLTSVLLINSPVELKQSTVRMAFRVIPPDDLDMRLFLMPNHIQVGIMDLSIGGIQFHHKHSISFESQQLLNVLLASGNLNLLLQCRVVRTRSEKNLRGGLTGVTSVRFEDLRPDTRKKYQQLIHATYRHLLAKRSGIVGAENS